MNAYFQIITDMKGTSVKLVPETDGGEKLDFAELMEYLRSKNIEIADAKPIYHAVVELVSEVVIPLSMQVGLSAPESFQLKVSEDKMEAVVRFYPPSSSGISYKGAEDILNDLKTHKIIYGIDEAALKNYLANRNYCEDIVVARGTEPVQGEDARIEYYFNTDLNTRPKRNEDGSVDFFHLDTINHCKEGDVLAKLYREVPGTDGCDVCGVPIRPRKVNHLNLRFGRNIELSEDGCEITSLVNGHVCLSMDEVVVSDVYEVENVGPATGNIESNGSVLVKGNVQAGFSIKAKGNVEIRGVVEGAVVETDGDIIIARGMNGMGKGILNAKGRIILKYAENATINSGEYIESESLLHSKVNARTEIRVDGRRGVIAGGVARAAERISCKTLGSPMGSDTQVEVGIDPEIKIRYQELQKESMQVTANLKNIQPILLNATQKIRRGETYSSEQLHYIQTLAIKNKEQMARLKEIQAELFSMDDLIQNQRQAYVRVSGDVYEGTKITIGDASLVLKSVATYCRFIREKGEIKVSAY